MNLVKNNELSAIDCHTHFFPKKYLKELSKMNIPLINNLNERFFSLKKREEDMNKAEIYKQVISVTVPGVDILNSKTSIKLSKMVNDELASITKNNGRFIALASLPMLSPNNAVEELERAINILDMKGACIFTNIAGKPIDSSEFWPVYELAQKLKVPIYIHPIKPVHDDIFEEFNLLSVLGFPFETTLTATRLALSGLMDKYSKVIFILSHLGGALPFLLGRIDDGNRLFKSLQNKIKKIPSEYLKQMYLDTASFFIPALNCTYSFWGAEKMLLGSDYPYGWVGELRRCIESIEQLEIKMEEKKRILYKNAEKILKF